MLKISWCALHIFKSTPISSPSLHIAHIKNKVKFQIFKLGPLLLHPHYKSRTHIINQEPSPVKPTKPQTSWISNSTTKRKTLYLHQVTPLDEVLNCTHKKQNTPRSLSPPYILEKLHFFFFISKKKYIKRTSRKQEANDRVQRGTQTKRKHKRKQKQIEQKRTKYSEEN